MKRIAFTVFILVMGLILAAIKPEVVSTVSILVLAVIALGALVLSLVAMPVTEYLTEYVPVERWREVSVANSFRYGINQFRGVTANYILHNGQSIVGELVGRSDSAGTYTIEVEEGTYETIPQASLMKVRTIGLANTPETMLSWDDTSPLLVPRSCS